MLSVQDFEGLIGPILLGEYPERTLAPMSVLELRDALKDIPGADKLTLSYADNGNQIFHIGDRSVEVGPMASNDEIRAALINPLVPTKNTKVVMSSAIDRIKAKAIQAKQIVPNAVRAVESDLDGIIAEQANLDKKRSEATAPHLEAIAGIKSELDGIKSALDILSNGGPALDPLPGSKTSA